MIAIKRFNITIIKNKEANIKKIHIKETFAYPKLPVSKLPRVNSYIMRLADNKELKNYSSSVLLFDKIKNDPPKASIEKNSKIRKNLMS